MNGSKDLLRRNAYAIFMALLRTSKMIFYENLYCITGAVKTAGSERKPKGTCTDKDVGTEKSDWF